MVGDIILHDAASARWFRFCNPQEIIATTSVANVMEMLHQVEKAVNQRGLHAAGFISYEAAPAFDSALQVHPPSALPLLWFGLYPQPEHVDMPLTDTAPPYTLGEWTPSVSEHAYRHAIAQIKDYIARGDTYQVNYTLRLQADFSGNPWGLFLKMARAQRGKYGAFVDTGQHVICSASPELFFTRNGLHLESHPMKGTAARGNTLPQDLRQIEWLQSSEKNRAENVMIVDMIRNDLSVIADWGSVRVPHLFTVERFPTILQMTSTVTAKSQESTAQVFNALFPCASITGAPKVRTMEIIRQLETGPRGIYTGSIGFMSPGRKAQFNVAIRTVAIDRQTGTAEYGVGSGIVWDSDAADEYRECKIKAKVLMEEKPNFDLLETILWQPDSGYFLLAEHLRRLADSAEYFNFTVDENEVVSRLNAVEPSLNESPHRVRLLVSQNGAITTHAFALGQVEPQQLPQVCLASEPVDSQNPFLYHKTTNRRIYELAKANHPNFYDVLLWNERGEITESCIANVVVQFGNKLVTPPVSSGLLAGTFRTRLLAQNRIVKRVITLEEIKRCDTLFLINSVRKWIKVSLAQNNDGER